MALLCLLHYTFLNLYIVLGEQEPTKQKIVNAFTKCSKYDL